MTRTPCDTRPQAARGVSVLYQNTRLDQSVQSLNMETMNELIPFAKEILSQKPNKKMVKMYVLGSVLAFFGVMIGLVETVCSPFTRSEDTDFEEIRHSAPLSAPSHRQKKEEMLIEKTNPQAVRGRSVAHRGHAS
ncbi:PREDICTED: G0/G1 switch protein 2 [Nanorana parkeri]|uniref:G0/G1 switch protein 2 n=1 Tax=Nanorana parkeri TaxID=125878 RepID=UPI000854378B|nr:PREDICTED: G0/G1 switch protein 2 [Nanorana parkeri]